MTWIAVALLVVVLAALAGPAVARRYWGRALEMGLEKLASSIGNEVGLSGYAADMRRLSLRISGGDKPSKKRARAILREWPSFLHELQSRTEAEVAERLFDMPYVRLQLKAAQMRLNLSGELAEPLGKHVAEMAGKREQDLTADDIELAMKCLDSDSRIPSQPLVDALGGLARLRALSAAQLSDLGKAEQCIELFMGNRGQGARLTPDDLNTVARNYLWLDRPEFFDALALRFGLPDFKGASLPEFTPSGDSDTNERAARQKIREAIGLGSGAARNPERGKLLAEALKLAPQYETRARCIEFAFRSDLIEK